MKSCAWASSVTPRARYQRVIQTLAARGARAIILGCTGCLIQPEHSALPRTALHAQATRSGLPYRTQVSPQLLALPKPNIWLAVRR